MIHFSHYIALCARISANVVAVDVGVVLVGDLSVVEPLDVVEEGEELSVGDRIEREQTLCSVYFRASVDLHVSAAAANDRAGNSALHRLPGKNGITRKNF